MATPSTQKFRPIGFALDDSGAPDAFYKIQNLVIRPEDLTRIDATRSAVLQTLGGAFADVWGAGLPTISIAGHTGWRGDASRDGVQIFSDLRDLVMTQYLRRREALLEVAARLDVPVILADQEDEAAAYPDLWLAAVGGLGREMADMARRCPLCYDIRLAKAAQVARALGFVRFSSTLLYSRYQNREAILSAGAKHAGPDLAFVGEDFREGWQRGIDISREWGIYRQPYCGCMLSEHDRYRKKIRLRAGD